MGSVAGTKGCTIPIPSDTFLIGAFPAIDVDNVHRIECPQKPFEQREIEGLDWLHILGRNLRPNLPVSLRKDCAPAHSFAWLMGGEAEQHRSLVVEETYVPRLRYGSVQHDLLT